LEFIGSIEMTGGEGFAKVMPAALVFLGALFIFLGLIKYSPSSYQF
jgi:hypothetical protein